MKTITQQKIKCGSLRDTLKMLLIIISITSTINVYSQHTNALPGVQWQFNDRYVPNSFHGEDWFYNVIQTSDGGYLAVGYVSLVDPNNSSLESDQPAAVKFDKLGNIMWEQVYPDNDYTIDSKVLNAFEDASGFVLMGDKSIVTGGNTISRLYYLKVDKNDGTITTNYKYVKASNFGYSDATTAINNFNFNFYEEFIAIKNSSGTITGFLYAGAIGETAGINGGAIIKWNTSGNIETSFGTNGLLRIKTNTQSNTFNTQLRSVCIEYDASGVPQKIAYSGSIKNQNTNSDNDIFMGKRDLATGNTTYWEASFGKSYLVGAFSYPSTTPSALCGIPTANNKSVEEFGGYIRQIQNNGDFIMVAHLDYSQQIPASPPNCNSYSLIAAGYYDHGVALIKVQASTGNIIWAKKLDHATGIDFFTPLQVRQVAGGQEFTIAYQEAADPTAVRSRVIKMDGSGNQIWNNLYIDDKIGQTENCLFGMALTSDGGLILAGNNDIDGENFELQKIAPDCNMNYAYTNVVPYGSTTVISGSTTWPSSLSMNGKILVTSTGLLTITGSTTKLRMADSRMTGVETNITVMPGGKLIVTNGAEITSIDNNTCPGSMWDGVIIQGNKNLDQGTLSAYTTIPNQGFVDMNASTISNARCAITTGVIGPDHMGVPGTNKTGGVIRAIDSYFINNNRDVQIFGYYNSNNSGNNKSMFRRCHFLINADINSGDYPTFRIYNEGTQGVKLQGNEFNYSSSTQIEPINRGWGIYSNDAAYTVGDDINGSTTTQSSFTDFRYSIEADNCNSLRTISVDHAIFTNTYPLAQDYTGHITLHTVNSAQITNNTLSLQNAFCWGISVNNSSNYGIRNNVITGAFSSSNQMYGSVGIYASNSGSGSHEIYRNTLHNLDGGICPQYNNGNPITSATDGLIMNCNMFLGNHGDIGMLTDNAVIPTVRKIQGLTTNQNVYVRNFYSANCVTSSYNQWYIDVSNGQQTNPSYQIFHPSNATAPSPYVSLPSCANPLLILTSQGGQLNYASQCSVGGHIPAVNVDCDCRTCCQYADISAALSTAVDVAGNLQTSYNNLIDGGNTTTLLTDIADMNTTISSIKTQLISYSPYLSDEVLSAFFNRPGISTDDILEVHNDNKPVTPAVWEILENLSLDAATTSQLNTQQAENLMSDRQLKDDELGDAKATLQSVYATKLNYFLLDTLDGRLDTVIAMLTDNLGNLPNAEIMLIEAYANKGDYNTATDLADALGSNYAELATLKKVLLDLDASDDGKTLLNNNQELYNTVSTYAADETMAGTWEARAVMRSLYGNDMGLHYLTLPNDAGSRVANSGSDTESYPVATVKELKMNGTTNTKTKNQETLGIYPNPANTSVNLVFKSRSSSTVNYVIVDLLGSRVAEGALQPEVKLEINTRDLKEGVYFVTLIQDNVLIEKQKLSIVK